MITEPQLQASSIKHLLTFEHVVSEICSQSDTQTDKLITILRSPIETRVKIISKIYQNNDDRSVRYSLICFISKHNKINVKIITIISLVVLILLLFL